MLRSQTFHQGQLHFVVTGSDSKDTFVVTSGRLRQPWLPLESEAPVQPMAVDGPRLAAWLGGGASMAPACLFGQLRQFYATWFSAPDEHVLDLVTLYTILTYLYAAVDEVPYLACEGEPDAGKTQLAKLLSHVAFNPVLSAGISPAAITRVIHLNGGTLLLDEQNPGAGPWRDVLRSGYRKGIQLQVCGSGPHDIVSRPTYGPKVLFTNEPLTDQALASRTLRVLMLAGQSGAHRYRYEDAEEKAADLRTELLLFALENVHVLRSRILAVASAVSLKNRDLDLAALPMSIAGLVDETSGGTLRVAARLGAYLQALSATRKAAFRDEALRLVLARCIMTFAPKPNTWVRADEYTDHVNTTLLLGRKLSSRDVGRLLGRYGLLCDRKVQDVQTGPSPSNPSRPRAGRLQKQHYIFNVVLAATWVPGTGAHP